LPGANQIAKKGMLISPLLDNQLSFRDVSADGAIPTSETEPPSFGHSAGSCLAQQQLEAWMLAHFVSEQRIAQCAASQNAGNSESFVSI
jgi:hypothetical protein